MGRRRGRGNWSPAAETACRIERGTLALSFSRRPPAGRSACDWAAALEIATGRVGERDRFGRADGEMFQTLAKCQSKGVTFFLSRDVKSVSQRGSLLKASGWGFVEKSFQ